MGFDMGSEPLRAIPQNMTPRSVGQLGTSKKTAPFGSWDSEITKDAVFSSSRSLMSPRVDVRRIPHPSLETPALTISLSDELGARSSASCVQMVTTTS
jgi:hypothetical protein